MNNNLIITIGREYGTGGREIGQKLALRLGVPFYDRELITRAAKKDLTKSCSSSSTSVPPTASCTR
mgnify:CR=1 FL=1